MIALLASLALADTPNGPLDDPAFRFCGEAGISAEEARDFCELLKDEPPERCPGMRKTCEGAPKKDDLADLLEQLRGCGDEGRARDFAPPEPPADTKGCDPEKLGCSGSAPNASSPMALLRWVAAALVAGLVLVILRVLVAYWSTRSETPVLRGAEVRSQALQVAHDDIPEGPPDDLLGAARRALDEGRHGDAVTLARGAALRRLAAIERIVLHRARTDREYVRMVSKDPNVQGSLRTVVSAAEIHRWGGRPIDRTLAQGAIQAAEHLLLIGAVALLLAIPGTANAGRYGPYGEAALESLYEQGGYDVSWRLRGLQSLHEDPPDVLVLDLAAVALEPEDQIALRDWVESGGVLVVGGDASAAFPELGTYVDAVLEVDGDTDTDQPAVGVAGVFEDPRCDVTVACPQWPGGPHAAYLRGPDVEVWVAAHVGTEPNAPVVAARIGSGGVIAIADVRLLRNASLVSTANGAFLLEAPYAGVDRGLWTLPTPATIELATRAGKDAETPFGALSEANLLPAVAQLLLFGALFGMWRGVAFAPLKDPPEQGRLSFSEHVRVLGMRYARLGASRRALAAVASLWLPRLGRAGLVAKARRAGMEPDRAEIFADAVEDAAKNPDGPDRPNDLTNLEDLWKAVGQ